MTISTEPVPPTYNGDDSTVDFAISWEYFAKSDVRVTLRNAAGVETTWVLDTDYTLTAAGDDDGGTLTATTAPATGETLVIELDTPNTQTASLPLGGSFPSDDVEDAIDRLTQIAAKIEQLFNRSLRVPRTDTESGDELELPIDADRASMFLAFDANGDPIAAAGTSADLGPVSAFIDTLLDDANFDAARTTLGTIIKRKTADESVASSTTLQDDNHLTFSIGASEEWVGRLELSAGALLGTTGIKVTLTAPSGATAEYDAIGITYDVTGTTHTGGSGRSTTLGTAIDLVAGVFSSINSAKVIMNFWILNSTTAGSITLQFAQSTSDVTAVTLLKGSHLVAHRVA